MSRKHFKGSHAEGAHREAFCFWVESGCESETFEDEAGRQWRIRSLYGDLWVCTDCMPSSLCDELGLPQGCTYAQGARAVRRSLLEKKK